MRITNWWEAIALPVIADNFSGWNLADLAKILTASISQCAVKCFQENDGKICTTLSGGLDSSFCLAKIREFFGSKAEIHTFTTGGYEEYPDVQFARMVSRYFGTIHHELIPSENEIRDAGEKLSFLWEDDLSELGDIAVFLTYQNIARQGFRCVIAHDGIDELLGGYWEHRKHEFPEDKEKAFRELWAKLKKEHLVPLERKARHFGIQVIFPYLQGAVVEYISKIPLDDRTSREVSKIPLRTIAEKYLPQEIIERSKKGFCSALDKR
jgi:asparagine synthase (glutamine-hydrolysing)